MNKIELQQHSTDKETLCLKIAFCVILAIGVLARLVLLGSAPFGVNQDEAFAGYNAYSLLKYGVDTSGYAFPVYFTAWGSGMNALETYLAMPFVAVLGLNALAIRLPQAITGIFSVLVVYKLVKKYSNSYQALVAMAMIALCPWHVMLSRWGLESNLAPGFILFGVYFFAEGLDNPKLLPLSALFFGLSLYSYATTWIYLPIVIGIAVVYAFAFKRLKIDRYSLIFVGVLFILALPLMLFLAVNLDLMPEVRTSFISIPRMLYFRSGEVNSENIAENFSSLISIIFKGTDGLIWNSPEKFGLFYPLTAPLFIVGAAFELFFLVKSLKEREFRFQNVILVAFVVAFICSVFVTPNVNRVNVLFIPMLLLASSGFYNVAFYLIPKYRKPILAGVVVAYLALFGFFEGYYFTDYKASSEYSFASGLGECVERSKEVDTDYVFVASDAVYARVLFYDKTDVNSFMETVEYAHYPAAYLNALCFDRYIFTNHFDAPIKGVSYIALDEHAPKFIEAGFEVEDYGAYIFAYYKGN